MDTFETLRTIAAATKQTAVAAQAHVNESTVSRTFNGENHALQIVAAAIDQAGYRLCKKGVAGVDDLAACDRVIYRLLGAQMRRDDE